MTYIRIKKFKNNPALDREIQKIKFYEDEKDAEETNRNDIETNEEHFDILAKEEKPQKPKFVNKYRRKERPIDKKIREQKTRDDKRQRITKLKNARETTKRKDLIFDDKNIPSINDTTLNNVLEKSIKNNDYEDIIDRLTGIYIPFTEAELPLYKINNLGEGVVKVNDTKYYFTEKYVKYRKGKEKLKTIFSKEAKEEKNKKASERRKETIKQRKQVEEDIKAGKSVFSTNFDDAVKEKRLMDVKNIKDKYNDRKFSNFSKEENLTFLNKLDEDLKELIKDFISRKMSGKDRTELNTKIIEIEKIIKDKKNNLTTEKKKNPFYTQLDKLSKKLDDRKFKNFVIADNLQFLVMIEEDLDEINENMKLSTMPRKERNDLEDYINDFYDEIDFQKQQLNNSSKK